MDLLQLRYFCTTARMLNISHAAAFHSIPQPAMSKTISRLEAELGVKLFLRSKNRILLTPEGEKFYRHAEKALKELDMAAIQLRQKQAGPQTHFRLLVTALQSRTAEFLAGFRQICPNVTFEVFKSAAFEPLHGLYALCITEQRPPEIYDQSIVLMVRPVELYAAVSSDAPLAGKERLCVEDLRDRPLIEISPSPVNSAFHALCRAHDFEPDVVITCDDLQCRRQYILSGAGISLTTAYSLRDLQCAGITLIPVQEHILQTVSAYWSSAYAAGEEWHCLLRELVRFYQSAHLTDGVSIDLNTL